MSIPLELTRQAPDVSDADLVAFARGGDMDAYGSLVRRHQDAIYRHLRGLGLDHDASLDVVQDAFVKAFDHLHECREGARFRAWLFRISRNLCFDELRNVRRRTTIPMSDLELLEIEDPRDSMDDLSLTLRAALDRVPSDLRDAFLLKHDAGYTYDEIAELTAASPSAVKMRVHRAREALRSFLRKQGYQNPENQSDNRGSPERLRNTEETERQASRGEVSGAPAKNDTEDVMKPIQMKVLPLAALVMLAAPITMFAQAPDAPGQGQGQGQAQAQGQGQGTAQARIDAALSAAAEAKIPLSLIQSKVAEGEAKRVPMERIAAAVEARLKGLVRASEAMDRAGIEARSEGELLVSAAEEIVGMLIASGMRHWMTNLNRPMGTPSVQFGAIDLSAAKDPESPAWRAGPAGHRRRRLLNGGAGGFSDSEAGLQRE